MLFFVSLARVAKTTTTASETNKTTQSDTNKTNKLRLMVSYSHADSAFCHQLVDALKKGK